MTVSDRRSGEPAAVRSPRSRQAPVAASSRWLRANLFVVDSLGVISVLLIFVLGKGARQLRAVGLRNAVWIASRQPDPRLPRGPRHRRLLGRHPRKVSLHPVRPLSVRPAMAAGAVRC